ncbi:DUF4065 domain-containing protein [Candidatus Sumerlaeota bacterium]|nr:DUF4065 domain-containing protein [Candidatus Sumerlaeota bacterium]
MSEKSTIEYQQQGKEMMDAHEKSERLIEAATAILAAAPNHRLNTVVLNKALFYLDLASLRDDGKTMTGNSYIALQQGPVVAKYQERLIGQLQARVIAEQLDEWDGSKPIVLKNGTLRSHHLDASAMSRAAGITAFFAKQTSQQASEYSHENPGWLLAWAEYRRSGKPCAIDMRVAMQQILQDDPWMDEPLIGDEDILAADDAESGTDW